MGGVSMGPQTVSTRLMMVHAPCPIVVVTEGWPSCLIPILTLKLPLAGAYFPKLHHQHFKSPNNSSVASWKPIGPPIEGVYNYVISGSLTFVKKMCVLIPDKN